MRHVFVFLLLVGLGIAARAQTVICFGDSLTAGFHAMPGYSYPDFLRKDLDAAGYRVTVVNDGVTGSTSSDGLAKVPELIAQHPTVVVLELGVNDALRGAPLATTEGNLRKIVSALQAAHARVVLAGLDGLPYLASHPNASVPVMLTTPEMRAFYGLYPRLAAEYKLPLVLYLLKGVYGVPELMSGDGMHPNEAGYAKVAETVLPYVERALGDAGLAGKASRR